MTGMYEQARPGIGHNQPDEYAEEKKHAEVGALGQEAHVRARARRHLQPPLQGAAGGEARLLVDTTCRGRADPASTASSVISPQATDDHPVDRDAYRGLRARAPSARSTATSTARCSTCSRAAATTSMTAGTSTWKAGDVMIVENGCVHQHFNDDPENEAILLVFKAKPLFLFMHLLFQKIVEWPPDEAAARARTITSRRRTSRAEERAPWRFEDKAPALSGSNTCTFHADALAASQEFRKQLRERAPTWSRPRTCRGSARPTA